VSDYISIFEPYKETYRQNNEYVCTVKETYKDSSLEVFRSEMDKYKAMTLDFQGIPAKATVGIMEVDSKIIRTRLMPSPLQCLFAIRELLPELMEEGASSLLDELGGLIPHITGTSASVEDFVLKKKAVVAAHEHMGRFREVR
ncbi:unnamed protein product, partial [Discosporangium mesarthrocarpum]